MASGGPLWPSLWTGTQGFSISLHSHSGLFSAAPGRTNQLYLISFYTQINCHSSHSYEFPVILRNISPKLESFPPNCSALSAVTGRLHQDRWSLDHPNYFLKSLTKWSQMITSHQYGMWGFWNGKAVSHIPFWNICHICHLSDKEDMYITMVGNENSYQVQIARVTTGLISPLLLPPLRGRDGQLEVRITAITAHFLSPQATS